MEREKIGWNNVQPRYCTNCKDCRYFEDEKLWKHGTVTAYCHYMDETPHSIDKFDIYRCARIINERERYAEYCASFEEE